jgi:hypothetical protein
MIPTLKFIYSAIAFRNRDELGTREDLVYSLAVYMTASVSREDCTGNTQTSTLDDLKLDY